MPKIPFNVDAYTARLIGRENVSKLEGAILELVKNTYDADASICVLYFENSTNALYIADNGTGMTEDVINKHWMTIGNSSKTTKYLSAKGRVQTGAKGIGRFALDRISDSCKMLTKTSSSSLEWVVNWSDFNTGKTITNVFADLNIAEYDFNDFLVDIKNKEVEKFISKKFPCTGTIFKLDSLRDNWSSALVDSIKRNLATLIPPEISNIFQLYLFCENSSVEDAKVLINDGLFPYDYKMEFIVDDIGKAKIRIFRNEFDFGDQFETIMIGAGFTQEDREYFHGKPIEITTNIGEMMPSYISITPNAIGSFKGSLYFAKLSESKEDKLRYFYKDISDRRDFKDTFGGIKIYRDNFRVRPYGEPKTTNYDWLLLSNRKMRSPAAISHPTGSWRVNADQMLGAVYISRNNIALPDQANREGIVETKEFMQLREFILAIIQLFERDRQYVCRLLNKYYEDKNSVQIIEKDIISRAETEEKSRQQTGQSPTKPEVIEVHKARTVIQGKDTIIKNLEDENRLLRALATTGIVTNTYIHEIKDLTHKLGLKIVMASEALELDNDKVSAVSHLDAAANFADAFSSWFKVTIESVRRDKRTMKSINLQILLNGLISSWHEAVKNKNIDIVLDVEDITFKCFPYEIESIFNNLITNSITSFESARIEQREIKIRVSSTEFGILIEYKDNGAGLDKAYKKTPRLILESFETNKRNEQGELVGTGMGMWIVAKTVTEYGGTIDLSQNITAKNGFYVKITLNTKS